MVWRLCSTITAYFFLSLTYSLVSLAFSIPFFRQPAPHDETAMSSAYGRAGFVVYWMVNFLATIAIGLASENMGLILGFPWFAVWLIFWVISNVATSFYPIPFEPGFYRYGYAWPLLNVVQATRTIIFDVHSQIGLNIRVLCAWAAVNIAVSPFANLIFRWKMMRTLKKGQKEKEDVESKGDTEADTP